ncbi:MAG: alpha/beta hydrolase [Spirochaetia bacterium]|nr:alpha/beta hydrolase [Spirochaetia bacterium]
MAGILAVSGTNSSPAPGPNQSSSIDPNAGRWAISAAESERRAAEVEKTGIQPLPSDFEGQTELSQLQATRAESAANVQVAARPYSPTLAETIAAGLPDATFEDGNAVEVDANYPSFLSEFQRPDSISIDTVGQNKGGGNPPLDPMNDCGWGPCYGPGSQYGIWVPPQHSGHQDVWVKLRRVGVREWFNWTYQDPEYYPYWDMMGVNNGHTEDTYIGTIWSPPVSQIENIVIIFAGQQSPGDGVVNVLTGQQENFKNGCSPTCWRRVEVGSMADKVFNNAGYFNGYKTYFAVVFDTRFNWQNSPQERDEMINAYSAWILSRAPGANLKKIYLAGSSRGGALAMHVARRMKQQATFQHVPMVVHTLDPVFNELYGEFNAQWGVQNPTALNFSDFYEYRANRILLGPAMGFSTSLMMNTRFFNVVGGHAVLFPNLFPGIAHGTTFYGGTSPAEESVWYAQHWVPLRHTQIGREYQFWQSTLAPLEYDWQYFFSSHPH